MFNTRVRRWFHHKFFSFSLILAFSLSSHSPHTPLPAPHTRRLQARRDGTSKDEPFAHASRERLRRKLVGKRVTFRVDRASSGAPGAREFGQIYLGDENVALAHVAEGWARVKQGAGGGGGGGSSHSHAGGDPEHHAQLVAAERSAVAGELGAHAKDPAALARSRRDVPDAFDARAFFASLPGDAAIPGVVEAVLNGGVLRVALRTDSSESRHAVVTAHVAGAQCPSMGKKPAPAVASASRDEREKDDALPASAPPASDVPAAPAPEPFAREAKHFTETRLLHRDVELFYAGEDKYKNAFFSVRVTDEDAGDPAFDPAVALVRAGLARVADWSVALVPSAARALRAAEREAKQQRLRLWRAYVPPPPSLGADPSGAAGGGASSRAFVARCVEAASGDTIVVQAADGAERKVHLSSVRAPRMGNARRGVDPEPWAFEAKEFLRARCVGRDVKVTLEYARDLGGGGGANANANANANGGGNNNAQRAEFGTVLIPADESDAAANSTSTDAPGGDTTHTRSGANAAEMLVLRGLATVVRHRGDEERSAHYDDLVAAEQRAMKGRKGVHRKDREPPARHVNDVSQSAQKSKQFLPFLQRAGRAHGVVEYVVNGHRMRVTIPKEGATVSFALSGARCPQTTFPGQHRETSGASPRADAAGDAAGNAGQQSALERSVALSALRLTRRVAMQRDVEIEVDAVDKTGTFLGRLWVPAAGFDASSGPKGAANSNPKVDLAAELLRRGLAGLHPSFDPARHPGGEAHRSAQEAARRARAGLWRDWTPEAEAARAAAAAAAASGADSAAGPGGPGGSKAVPATVSLTETVTGSTFFAHVDHAGEVAERIRRELASRPPPPPDPTAPFSVRPGQLVAAKFSEDGGWYRAAIVSADADSAAVFFRDYGNVERVPLHPPGDSVRPLDPALAHDPPACATLCVLEGVKAPPRGVDGSEDAALESEDSLEWSSRRSLADYAGGKPILSRVARLTSRPAPAPWAPDAAPEASVVLGGVEGLEEALGGGGGGGGGDDESDGAEETPRRLDEEASASASAAAGDAFARISVNERMVLDGALRVDRRYGRGGGGDGAAFASRFAAKLSRAQEAARRARRRMWEYGDVDSDEEELDGGRRNKTGAWGRRR